MFALRRNQLILQTIHFGGLRRISGKLLSNFLSMSPKFDDFWPQVSPILPNGTSPNDKNHCKNVLASSK